MCHVELALLVASRVIGAPLELLAIERARFVRKALPGEELTIRIQLGPASGAVCVDANHSIGGEPAAELRIVVMQRTDDSPSR